MAGTTSALVLVDVLKMVEKYETVDGVKTLTLKPGIYEQMREAVLGVNAPCHTSEGATDWNCSPLVVGGVLFKPSDEKKEGA